MKRSVTLIVEHALASIAKVFRGQTFATSVAQTFLTRSGLLFLTVISGIITSRTLGPVGRGDQSAIVVWPFLISGLASLGVSPAVIYYTSRSKQDDGDVLFAGSVIALIGGIVGAIITALIVPHYLSRYSATTIRFAQLMLAFAPIIILGGVFQANLQARGLFTLANTSQLITAPTTLCAVVLLAGLHRLTPVSATLAFYVPIAAQTAVLGSLLRSRFALMLERLPTTMQALFSYGIRAYGTEIVNTLSGQIDQVMIISFLTPAALGLYTVALTASRTLNLIQSSLTTVLLPRASSLTADEAVQFVARATRLNNSFTLVAALAAEVLIPVLLPLFYGKAFIAAIPITRLLIIDAWLMSAALVSAQAFRATGRPGVVTLLQGGWLIASVAFLLLFVPQFGALGAAYALLAASVFRLVASLACYPLVLKRSMPAMIAKRSDLGYLKTRMRALGLAPSGV